MGFPRPAGRASLADANGNIHHGEAFEPQAAEGDFERPQRAAEARLASRDCAVFRRRFGDQRDHAADRQGQHLRLALARAVHAGGRCRPAPRQDAALARSAAWPGGGRARRGADLEQAAGSQRPVPGSTLWRVILRNCPSSVCNASSRRQTKRQSDLSGSLTRVKSSPPPNAGTKC